MENASKALLIAGGMILVILILSVFVYISRKTAKSTSNIYENLEESAITEFNQQFLNFQEKQKLTMQDVVSVAYLAKNNNEKRKMPVEVHVFVVGDGWNVENMQNLFKDNIEKLLKDHFSEEFKKCSVKNMKNSKLVGEIRINSK